MANSWWQMSVRLLCMWQEDCDQHCFTCQGNMKHQQHHVLLGQTSNCSLFHACVVRILLHSRSFSVICLELKCCMHKGVIHFPLANKTLFDVMHDPQNISVFSNFCLLCRVNGLYGIQYKSVIFLWVPVTHLLIRIVSFRWTTLLLISHPITEVREHASLRYVEHQFPLRNWHFNFFYICNFAHDGYPSNLVLHQHAITTSVCQRFMAHACFVSPLVAKNLVWHAKCITFHFYLFIIFTMFSQITTFKKPSSR